MNRAVWQATLPSVAWVCGCSHPGIGRWRFHILTNALAVARRNNIRAGEKVYCVVIRQGHFEVVLED